MIEDKNPFGPTPGTRLTKFLPEFGQTAPRPLIGVLKGTGIGPDVVGAALEVLKAVEDVTGLKFELRHGGAIGEEAEAECGQPLTEAVACFCEDIFEEGGAILSGPGGGRYVYDLRRHFDLFCKFVPVVAYPELGRAGKLLADHVAGLDLLIVRDNIGGVYQGQWKDEMVDGVRVAEHCFRYDETEVARLVEVAARAAAARSSTLHIIVKEGGVPGITALWREVGIATARRFCVEAEMMNVDLAAYEMIQNPRRFDVMVAPNLIGDILADAAGVLVSSRGVTFSGNYTPAAHGVYQTNHGCAHDLARTGTANPGGQILSLAMLLRESLNQPDAAELVEQALFRAWAEGWRTADIAEPGCVILGTEAMTEKVVEQISHAAAVQPER
ncbi:MAG: isocitrate/isopropylmalate family dehydrogenase [Verrucomicrobiales bacterium]|nr:isocitrate/isopropylmalate family dehydrogenase [Verrucomicrobiales bacterium]